MIWPASGNVCSAEVAMNTELGAVWLLTLGMHVGTLLVVAWSVDRANLRAYPGWREWMWRLALFGGLLTSTGQVLLDTPGAARISLAARSHETLLRSGDAVQSAASSGIPSDTPQLTSAAGFAEVRALSVSSRPQGTATGNSARTPSMGPQGLPSWHLLVVATWLAGCLIGLGRLARAWLRMREGLVRARPIRAGRIYHDAAELAARAGIRCPHLTQLDELASPIAANSRRIVLPDWVFEQFDPAQLRAMLAHEIAHLARRDPLQRLAVAGVCALLWFMPLTSLARRRLDEIAEQSCDAWAADQLGDRRAMAECLARCAERRLLGAEFALAASMAHRHSPLLQRITHLLEGRTVNMTISMPGALAATALLLIVSLLVLPGVGIRSVHAQSDRPAALVAPTAPTPLAEHIPVAAPVGKGGTHLHVSSETDASGHNRQSTFMETEDGNRAYRAKIDGLIVYNSSYDGVASLGKDSTASFGETNNGVSRRIEYANQAGKLERHYFVADVEQPIDRTAETWIAAIIPELIRETAVDAAKRVRQIHTAGGTAAVLDEIGRIHSDYARGEYIEKLASVARFTPMELTRVLGLVDPFETDFERRKALTAIGAAGKFDANQQALVIGQAMKIESDHERAELLLSLLPNLADNDAVRRAWLNAANGIDSDYEHRRCLSALVEAGGNDDATMATVIEAARTINSDYERRELLSTAIRAVSNAENVAEAYTQAVNGMSGAYERREALLALIHAQGFGVQAAGAVLASLGRVDSDHESREVLVELAHVMPSDAGLIDRYRAVASKLDGIERSEAERALDRVAL